MLAVELYEAFAVVCPTDRKSLGCWVSYLDKRVAQGSLTVHTVLLVNFVLVLVTFLCNISFFLLSCLDSSLASPPPTLAKVRRGLKSTSEVKIFRCSRPLTHT